jgi:hypothetical protein
MSLRLSIAAVNQRISLFTDVYICVNELPARGAKPKPKSGRDGRYFFKLRTPFWALARNHQPDGSAYADSSVDAAFKKSSASAPSLTPRPCDPH